MVLELTKSFWPEEKSELYEEFNELQSFYQNNFAKKPHSSFYCTDDENLEKPCIFSIFAMKLNNNSSHFLVLIRECEKTTLNQTVITTSGPIEHFLSLLNLAPSPINIAKKSCPSV
jgi:hypothetical protein